MASSFSDSVFEQALSDSMRQFPHISTLKKEQKLCLQAVAKKRDVFGVLPTGFGKSLIFQLLPLVLKALWNREERATVLIVTPLVSIMKDQVEEMTRLGLKAHAIGLGEKRADEDLRAAFDVDLIYGSPESWLSEEWSRELKDGQLGKQIVTLVVDEVHAVSAWGEVSVNRKGKKAQPFREAFARVKNLRSFLPGVPVLALTASVKVKDRSALWKSCGMISPLVVNVSPNKDNIFLGFQHITVEADALKHIKWVAAMIEKEQERTPQTIIFCKTFNDIASVISYLLMNLRGKAFLEKEGQKVALLGVYHAKTWETQKTRTEEDFKGSGTQRVVIATSALGMGINFSNVKYVVHYGPPRTTTEIIQQAGRAGRNGQQAFTIVYATNRQLSQCDTDVKELFKSGTCMRVCLYGHFEKSVLPKEPAHFCCSLCRSNCQCAGDRSCVADELEHLSLSNEENSVPPSNIVIPSRVLNELDKRDLRLALLELKEQYSLGIVSLFHQETSHGFTDKLINDIINHAKHIFCGKYLTENLAIYSSRHAIDILEVFQELFDDIDTFEQEIDELNLLKKQLAEIESYLLSSSISSDVLDDREEVDMVVPEYDLDF